MGASNKSIRLWVAGVTVAWVLWRAANRKRHVVLPRPDQIAALFERVPKDGKIHMLNMIKFRERAVYDDGRDTQLTGADAYAIYDDMNRQLISESGGRIIFSGEMHTLVIGVGAQCEYDRIILIEFPSMEAYNSVAAACVEKQKECDFQAHQWAGVAYQQLIHCNATTTNPFEIVD